VLYNLTTLNIQDKVKEKVKSFKYLGNTMSYERELDIGNKSNSHLKITGILNNVFRPQKNFLRKQE
jgi:hypothetical protein